MGRKSIMIDMDEVIVVGIFSEFLTEFLGEVDFEKLNGQNRQDLIRGKEEEFKKIYKYKNLYKNDREDYIEPLPDCVNVVKELNEKYDVYIVTAYVWKENEKYTSIIKNDGSRVILNKKDSDIWKIINDDDTVDDIIRHMKDTMSANQVEDRLEEFIKIGIITNEDMFWGDDLL